jgi:hypothetical protein
MKPWSMSLQLALLAVALISSTLNAEIIFGPTILGRYTARNSFDFALLKKTKSLGISNEPSYNFLTTTCRGGAIHLGEDESDEYDDEEGGDAEGSVENTNQAGGSLPTALNSVVSTLNSISKAIMRALGSLSKDSDEKDSLSLPAKIFQKIRNMITAALSPEYDKNQEYEGEDEDGDQEAGETPKISENPKPAASPSDLGGYLAKAYGVSDGRQDPKETPVLGGSLTDALKIARSSAKLLVVLIPSNAPNKAKKNDVQAITSFLSAEVAKVAKKKARKKGESGSYIYWSAKAGSSEASQAMKRLKVKATSSKGDKRPILLVAYAASVSSCSLFGLLSLVASHSRKC